MFSNSLRMSATKAIHKQCQGIWGSCFGRLLRSQLLFPLAQECANHHPNCRKPRPGSGGKSTFPCQLERCPVIFFFKEGNDIMAALGLYCYAQAQLPQGMWHLPRPGIEPRSLHQQADSQPLHHQGSPALSFLCIRIISAVPQNKKGRLLKRATSFSFILCCYNK